VTDERGALTGLRVLELVDQPVEYCGRMLAGLGADVIKVEPAQGARSRHEGPYVEGRDGDLDASLTFWHFNVGKRAVVSDDADELRDLCRTADVVIHSSGPAAAAERGLDHASLARDHPDLITCAITPFGLTGPWADYVADDLVLMALGGSMAACGYGTSDPPLACWGDQAWLTAATYGAIAVLAAIDHRAETGEGQLIDVSAHQASASMTEWHVMTYLCSGAPMARFRHPTVTARDDKQVAALVPDFLGPHVFANFLAMLEADGVAGPLTDEAFADPRHRARHYGEMTAATTRLAERHDGEELFRLGQSAGLPWGVIRSPDEVLEDPHLQARGHFVDVDGHIHAGAPFIASGSPFRFERPPPRLGQHTSEVRAEVAALLASIEPEP
jgi:crotonobetainyl-CoA:carnitine CoA-transferase CaiB-like acyl-CoA transferase